MRRKFIVVDHLLAGLRASDVLATLLLVTSLVAESYIRLVDGIGVKYILAWRMLDVEGIGLIGRRDEIHDVLKSEL